MQSAAFAVRSNISNSTKCSPAELVLGSTLHNPIGWLYPKLPSLGVPYNQKQAQKFVQDLASNIKRSTENAQQVLEKSRLEMKRQYNKKAGRYCNLSVGDNVMLWDPYFNAKLSRCFQRKWTGPFIIETFTGDTNCKIINSSGQYKFVHVNQLKRIEPRKHDLNVKSDFTVKPSKSLVAKRQIQENNVDSRFILFDSDSEADVEAAVPIGIVEEAIRHPRAVIEQHWVAIDPNNIIPSRTRSGAR